MKTATFIRKLEGWRSDARLFKLNEPLEGFDYIVVSASDCEFRGVRVGPETYIFGSSSTGHGIDFSELPGSFRGGLDHAKALAGAGYTILEPDREGLASLG